MLTIKLNAHLSAILKSAPYVTDAPNDGITYGRKDSKWVPVQTEIKTENTQTIELLVDEETSTLSANLIKAKPVSDSRAITVETLVRDYNKLLASLREAGILDIEDVHYDYVTYDGIHLIAFGDDASKLIVY